MPNNAAFASISSRLMTETRRSCSVISADTPAPGHALEYDKIWIALLRLRQQQARRAEHAHGIRRRVLAPLNAVGVDIAQCSADAVRETEPAVALAGVGSQHEASLVRMKGLRCEGQIRFARRREPGPQRRLEE